MTLEELTTIIGLLEKVEDKRLAFGAMWDEHTKCHCAQGAICPKELWEGHSTLSLGSGCFVTTLVEKWATALGLSSGALDELEDINDSIYSDYTPEERYQEVMKALRERHDALSDEARG